MSLELIDILVNVIIAIGSSFLTLGASYLALGQKVAFFRGKLSHISAQQETIIAAVTRIEMDLAYLSSDIDKAKSEILLLQKIS